MIICRQKHRQGCVVIHATLLSSIFYLVSAFSLLSTKRNHAVLNHQRSLRSRLLFKNDKVSAEETANPSAVSSSGTTASRPHRVQFAAPLLDYGYPPTVEEFRSGYLSEKPILLYLPGFDGTYICPFIQYPELGTEFEIWCMTVGMNDRSTYDELKSSVLDFVEQLGEWEESGSTDEQLRPADTTTAEANGNASATTKSAGAFWSSWFTTKVSKENTPKKSRRPIYLAGESFGGILASDIALTLLETPKRMSRANIDLQGLVLINPATCYDRSQLAAKGPPVVDLPACLYPFGLAGLLPLFTDDFSLPQLILILRAKALPSVIDDPARESFMGRVAFSLPKKLEYMSQGTLEWRLKEWLTQGCERMASRMRDFENQPSFRTLILAGELDKTLPSIVEAERLVNLLPKCKVHVVEGAGHASTCGSRLDMTAQLRRAFPELLRKTTKNNKSESNVKEKRLTMKPEAASGVGPYFGMEPRYDGANIGLNPIAYWSASNFQSVERDDQVQQVAIPGEDENMIYNIAKYAS